MKTTNDYAVKIKLVFLVLVVFIPVLILVLRNFSSSRFEVAGIALGIIWMIYNFYGFLFGKDMSMRGGLPKANAGGDSSVRRVLTFTASLIIYLILIYQLYFS